MQRILPLAIAAAFFATGPVARAADQQQTVPDQAPLSSRDMPGNEMGGGMGNGAMTGRAQDQRQSAPAGQGREMMGGMTGNQEMMAQMIRMMENCNRMMESQMQSRHQNDAQPQVHPDKKG